MDGNIGLELHVVELRIARAGSPPPAGVLITASAAAALAAVAVGLPSAIATVQRRPADVVTFLALGLAFDLLAVEVHRKGMIGVSAIAKLAAGFTLGPGVAMLVAATLAVTHSTRRRALGMRAVFDASNWTLSAGAAALVYQPFAHAGSTALLFLGATLAAAVYTALNLGLLCLAMALTERTGFRAVWYERFHWARFHFLGYGALALALTLSRQKMGFTGVVAFALPPVLMIVSVRQYLQYTRRAVDEVREANEQMRRAHRDTIAALSRTIEAKDDYTGGHTERVAAIAVAVAGRLGFRGDDLDAIEIGALLHDVGKIGVPEHILSKPGPLDEPEWAIMKRHPVLSDFILAETDLHPFVREIARWSHERIDGAGYPDGLAGDAIPLPARIVLVADAFDALTSDRPYRPRRTVAAALEELRSNSGTQFCPRAVGALERVQREEPRLFACTPAPLRIHAAA